MAKNKTSKIDLNSGLFEHIKNEPPSQNEQELHPNLTTLFSPGTGSVSLEGTRGKKGCKLKRINMAFNDNIHSYITYESRRRGISATQFVNNIIAEYMSSEEGYIKEP